MVDTQVFIDRLYAILDEESDEEAAQVVTDFLHELGFTEFADLWDELRYR